MPFTPKHGGLLFTQATIERVQKYSKRDPFKPALEILTGEETTPEAPLLELQLAALRYRLLDDDASAQRALSLLETHIPFSPLDELPAWDALTETFILAQAFEMLREYPAYTGQGAFLDSFFSRISALNERIYEPTIVEQLWLAVVNTTAGIVLEREPIFKRGTDVYEHVISAEVHPEGYLPQAVEAPETESLTNQILAAGALVLIAEMAACADVDLWAYEVRGVSVLTATTYPLYYYFYPDKWKWNGEKWRPSDGVPEDVAQNIFKQYGGFLEIANHRYDKPLKALTMILDDTRPMVDPLAGGIPTLTHAQPQRRGLFG